MSVISAGTTSTTAYVVTPDTTGEFVVKTGASNVTAVTATADGLLQFNSGYGSVATAYGCRAWVNFNGTGTVAIRASGNVSSITDFGTGDYGVQFTTAMPDADYSVVATQGPISLPGQSVAIISTPIAGSARLGVTGVSGGSAVSADPTTVSVAIFR